MNISSALFCLLAAVLPAMAADEKVAPAPMPSLKVPLPRVEADFNAIRSAVIAYKLTCGVYPTEEQGLKALVEKPKTEPVPRRWVQFMAKVPQDPWKRDYRLQTRIKDGKKETLVVSDGPNPDDKKDDREQVIGSEPVEKK